MQQREALIEGFLTEVGWQDAARAPLAGDASFRRYVRLSGDSGASAMLMDAPPPQEDVRPFVTIANRLLSMGLSAPKILASKLDVGLLLLEDFGDATYTQILRNDGDEVALYQLATETLIELHRQFSDPGDIPPYDDTQLLDEAALLVDWFLPALRGCETSDGLRREYLSLWRDVLALDHGVPATLVLRDYHVDNLMHLSDRQGVSACGLLDFQDAVIGPSSYDLVSLLEDARRDVPAPLAANCLAQYLSAFPELDPDAFRASYAILGAQRSAKIVGIFTRLDWRDGKPFYLKHVSRVFRWLSGDLEHPALAKLQVWFDREIPLVDRTAPPQQG
ncbi:MAG: aminoglycoside phosphotransferase family protein [Alphaproteobacteria bacterium]